MSILRAFIASKVGKAMTAAATAASAQVTLEVVVLYDAVVVVVRLLQIFVALD